MNLLHDHATGLALPTGFGAVYADPAWRFKTWNNTEVIERRGHGTNVSASTHYRTMTIEEIEAMPVEAHCAPDCVLFLWVTWPMLLDGLRVMERWGFAYKTCGFSWMKADATQINMFDDAMKADMGMGYWTRANSEVCLLGTRGDPKRLSAAVRQGIIEPSREHSRKPDCVPGRIEQLVAGPYLELFSRTTRPGWTVWGNEVGKFAVAAE